MDGANRLLPASIFFAVTWTLAMIWWTGPSVAKVIVWSIGGAIIGVLWYFGMKWYFRFVTKWMVARHDPSGE